MATPVKKGKLVDKWKSKQWFTVLAPQAFDNKEIAEIVSAEEDNLKNRILSLSLAELTGQPSQSSIFTFMNFRIKEVKGKSAYTTLIGHEISPSYIRTLSRRNRSIINLVRDLKTKDEQQVRVKILAITGSEVSQNTKKNIHHALLEELGKATAEFTYDQLMQEVVFGKLAMRLFNRLKQITAIRRVEVRKTELKEAFA